MGTPRRIEVRDPDLDVDGGSANWCVDVVDFAIDHWTVMGWAVSAEGRQQLQDFEVDGTRRAAQRFARPDITRLYPGRPGSEKAGFTFTVPTEEYPPDQHRPLRLSLRLDGQEQPSLDYFYPGIDGIIPSPENRRRVHGSDGLSDYLLEGFSAFVKIERVLDQVSGRRYNSFPTILDWGVGCGRFSRYFEPHRASGPLSLIGIDIDEINVQWCQQYAPWMHVQLVDAVPPTPLDEGGVDLVIGVSVFTHLREPDMVLWLEELFRLVRPGGFLAVTTHGDTTLSRSGLGPAYRSELHQRGQLDIGHNSNIDGAVPNDYYRNVFHTESYVRSVFGRFFTVLAFIPGIIGNNQDLVILRRD
jgi:SAM-dependent methyltransferase